ncbi:MAG: hypothetical protein IJK71_11565 [Clostridia bacterium]|nr:hypothetical protein [Clostridia bacterium]
MEREAINDLDLDKVVGGSIIFNADLTTCGRKNNHEYKVLNYSAVDKYIKENCTKMPEKQMMSNMVAAGLLAKL